MVVTKNEAAQILRLESADDYPQLDILLPAADNYINNETGKDWAADENIDPLAKMAVSVLVARWFEDPALIGEAGTGLEGLIEQLREKALLESGTT